MCSDCLKVLRLGGYCIILIEWSAHVTHVTGGVHWPRWSSWPCHCYIFLKRCRALPKMAISAYKHPFWHCNGVQKPSVTHYMYQIHSVQTCLLHVTEHLIEMIQYRISQVSLCMHPQDDLQMTGWNGMIPGCHQIGQIFMELSYRLYCIMKWQVIRKQIGNYNWYLWCFIRSAEAT